jgi:hypothetical protein
MDTLQIVVIGATVIVNAAAAVADVAKAEFVLKTAAEVGAPRSWLPALAALKGAGAAGLLLGLLGFPTLETAAAAGLVLFFVGALIAHVRARVFYNIAFPGFFFALALGSLILSISK